MSNKHLMIVELSPEHAIGLQNSPLARDALLIQGIKKAIVKLHSTEVDVIVLDFGTHGGPSQANSPVDACRQLTAASPNAKIIAIGATDDYLAGQLLLPNVYDVLAYPSDTQVLPYAVQRARRLQQIRLHNISLTKVRPLNELIPGLMSSDAAVRRVVKRARRLLGHNLRILIQGEPGTGRKTLAHYFAQYNGQRPGTDSAQLPAVPMPTVGGVVLGDELVGDRGDGLDDGLDLGLGDVWARERKESHGREPTRACPGHACPCSSTTARGSLNR